MATIEDPASIGLYRIGPGLMSGVSCHLLVDEQGDCTLIDSGFILHHVALKRLFRRLGLAPGQLKAILQTHAHLDHAGRLHEIRAWSGAEAYLHPAEEPILTGDYRYVRLARVCGVMEAAGRVALRYTACQIDHALQPGQVLPFWGGLEVVHLPGHTEGHCGFYSHRHDLLFAGDVAVAFPRGIRNPPPTFNAVPEQFPQAHRRVLEIDPANVVLNHYLRLDPPWQATLLKDHCRRQLRR